MRLLVKRDLPTGEAMTGELLIDGQFECYTLEDILREVKIAGKTAIAAGTYTVIINRSNRFGVDMPLLLNVFNFEGVRIHWGNKAVDTDGCLLVGSTKSKDFIGNSRIAYKALFAKMQAAIDRGEKITITYVDAKPQQIH